MLASDRFLVLCPHGADRLDLGTLEVKPLGSYHDCALAGDSLIATTDQEAGEIDLTTGRFTPFGLRGTLFSPVATANALYGVSAIRHNKVNYYSLLRMAR